MKFHSAMIQVKETLFALKTVVLTYPVQINSIRLIKSNTERILAQAGKCETDLNIYYSL